MLYIGKRAPPKSVRTFCELPWSRAKIMSDGKVHMCCHQGSNGIIGNLMEASFDELWNNRTARLIRGKTLDGYLHPHCQKAACPFFYTMDENTHRVTSKARFFKLNPNGYPYELEFDLHPRMCNFGGGRLNAERMCIACPRSGPGASEHFLQAPDLTDVLLDKVKHLIPTVRSLAVLGLAEPFWRDQLFHVLDVFDFRKYRKRITFWTFSNGTVFDVVKMRKFNEYVCCSELSFSIDACTPETYLQIRKHHLFNRVLSNIRHWIDFIAPLNVSQECKHTVNITANINILNVHETPGIVELAKSLGINGKVIFVPTHDGEGFHTTATPLLPNESNWHIFRDAQKEATQAGRELEMHVEFVRDLDYGFGQRAKQ